MKATCPSCSNVAELPDRALGKKARCAKCQNPFTVQVAMSQLPPVVEGVASPTARKCPSCGASLPPGDLLKCSYCGVNLATPALAAPKGAEAKQQRAEAEREVALRESAETRQKDAERAAVKGLSGK